MKGTVISEQSLFCTYPFYKIAFLGTTAFYFLPINPIISSRKSVCQFLTTVSSISHSFFFLGFPYFLENLKLN